MKAGTARGWLGGPVCGVSTSGRKQRRRGDKNGVKIEPGQFIEGAWGVEDRLRLTESIQRELLRLHSIKVEDNKGSL